MDTKTFLQTVLPPTGLMCVATPRSDKNPDAAGWKHSVRTDLDALLATVTSLNEAEQNIYFALGTLKQEKVFIPNEYYPDGNQRFEVRTKDNISQLKTFFLDIDVKPGQPDKHYETLDAAWQALWGFVQTTGLPAPLVVCSGGGLHVYFPFIEPLNKTDWTIEAAKLKEICKHNDLLCDHGLTANCACVLRVPGTFNRKLKDNPRAVGVLHDGVVSPLETLTAKFNELVSSLNLRVHVPTEKVKASGALADMMGGMESQPIDPQPVIMGCKQMAEVFQKKGDVSEPHWYAALQVARHFTNGNRIAHAMSEGHPEYDYTKTEAKLNQLEQGDYGPTTCGRFSDANPQGCRGCEYEGRAVSPVSIIKLMSAPAPQQVIEKPKEESVKPIQAPVAQAVYEEVATTMVTVEGQFSEIPNPPKPFFRNMAGEIVMMKKNKEGEEEPITILHNDLYPFKREMSIEEGGEVVWFRRTLPHDGWREFAVPTSALYSTEKIFKILADNGVLPSQAQKLNVVSYMTAYANALQNAGKAVDMHAHFGWTDDDSAFVVGDRVYHADGRVVKSGVSPTIAREAENLGMKGDLNTWRNAFNIYNRKGYEQWAFMAMLGFGAPLLKFTGYNGVIVDLHGPSGSGKSTATKFAASIFGRPKENILRLDDTGVSKFKVLGTYHNLPVTLDEITNIGPKELSQFAYAVTEGREKRRMSSDAVLRNDSEEWQTLVLASSNARIMDKLTMAKGNVTAEQMRVFEMFAPDKNDMDPRQVDAMKDALEHNHGVAGHVYAHYVVNNKELVRQRVKQVTQIVHDRAKLEPKERFWAAVVAVGIVGAGIAKDLKLHNYDVMNLLNWSINHIATLRGQVNSFKADAVEVLGRFGMEFAGNMLVTGKAIMGDAAIIKEPHGELVIRQDVESGMTYIDKRKFSAWCIEQQFSPDEVCDELQAKGILVDGHTQLRSFSMGSKTHYAGASVKVLVLDLRQQAAGNARPATVERGVA